MSRHTPYRRPARRVRRNPFDYGAVMTPIAIGAVALIGFKLLEHSDVGRLIGLGKGAGLPGLSPGYTPPALPNSSGAVAPGATQCGWAYIAGKPGNARLTFDVTPYDPPRQEGASVVYTGRLTAIGIAGLYERGIAGMRIDFVDVDQCVIFDSARTNSDGVYRLERPLASDELNGYRVMAVFQNDEWSSNFNLGRAATGIWHVQPR
jgi:hypothetical protein